MKPHSMTGMDALALSLSGGGPIISACVGVSILISIAGRGSIWSLILGTLGMLAFARIIAILASKYHGVGGLYEYMRNEASPALSGAGGLIYFTGMLLISVTPAVLLGQVGAAVFPWPWWITALGSIAVFFVLNHLNTRYAPRIGLWITGISMLIFIGFALYLAAMHPIQWGLFSPQAASIPQISAGSLIMLLMYVGFEMAAMLGDEIQNPAQILRAILITILAYAAFYIVMVYSASLEPEPSNVADHISIFHALADKYLGPLAFIIQIPFLADILAVGLALMAGTARGMVALSRDRILPEVVGRLSRHNTPLGGNVVVLAANVVVIGGAAIGTVDPGVVVSTLVTGGTLLVATAYLLVTLMAWKYFTLLDWVAGLITLAIIGGAVSANLGATVGSVMALATLAGVALYWAVRMLHQRTHGVTLGP